jgi:endonuclease-8
MLAGVPEGDTIFRLAAKLAAALVGKTIERCESHVAEVDAKRVRGASVVAVESRGKHLLIALSNGYTLHSHLRMEGSWHLYPRAPAEAKPKRSGRLRLETSDLEVVCARAPTLRLVATERLARDPTLSSLGPDPLAADFDAERAADNLARLDETPLGVALMNQRALAGVGNVLKSETLFLAGLDPLAPVARFERDEVRRAVDTAAELLRLNVQASSRGPGRFALPRRVTRVTSGALLGRGGGLWVYERGGEPCRKCGARIERHEQGLERRSTYLCPRCQPRRP